MVRDYDHFRQKGSFRPQSAAGMFPLIVDPIIGKTRLSRLLIDGGSGLNLLYTETYDTMGLSRAVTWPSDALFHGVIPRLQAIPLG